MNQWILIKGLIIVNEGKIVIVDVFLLEGCIVEIGKIEVELDDKVIDGIGKYFFLGIIDGQVYFWDLGVIYKVDLYIESKVVVAGGVIFFIDMFNIIFNILMMECLNEKYEIVFKKFLANYFFFLGVNGDNLDEVIKIDIIKLMGVFDDGLYFIKKGNLLVDNLEMMEKLFVNCKFIIVIYLEKEQIVE